MGHLWTKHVVTASHWDGQFVANEASMRNSPPKLMEKVLGSAKIGMDGIGAVVFPGKFPGEDAFGSGNTAVVLARPVVAISGGYAVALSPGRGIIGIELLL